jgi:hypothetical protein
MPPSFEEALGDSVEQTIVEHQDVVEKWLGDTPGAWGSLAGTCVLACRERLGRRLTEAERRAAWQALWDRLVGLRNGRRA